MSQYRPPLGGLFRLQAPRPERGADVPTPQQSEARDAIRHFVSVLERLAREAHRPGGKPQLPRPKRGQGR